MPQPNEIRNLEELYQAYAGSVYGYLLRLSGDPALADDLTSETFFQAMLGLDGFAGRSSVKTWLLRIARYLYIRRSQRERRHTSLESLEDQGIDFPGAAAGRWARTRPGCPGSLQR